MLSFLAEYWHTLLVTLIYVVSGIFTLIKLIKKNKNVKIGADSYKRIVEELPNLLKIAENIVGLNGESKKSFVMNQIKLMISGTGITASEEDINSISTMIDSLVDLSKNINTAVNKHDINTVTGV